MTERYVLHDAVPWLAALTLQRQLQVRDRLVARIVALHTRLPSLIDQIPDDRATVVRHLMATSKRSTHGPRSEAGIEPPAAPVTESVTGSLTYREIHATATQLLIQLTHPNGRTQGDPERDRSMRTLVERIDGLHRANAQLADRLPALLAGLVRFAAAHPAAVTHRGRRRSGVAEAHTAAVAALGASDPVRRRARR